MNLTVGPLPPAVYWRRRAIVLGGLLLVILLIANTCGGSGTSDASGRQAIPAGGKSPSPQSSLLVPTLPSPSPSLTVTTPASQPATSGSTSPLPVGAVPPCSDSDIQVTPEISSTAADVAKLQFGGTFDMKLKVRNISDHACTRDVGSVPEELRIVQGSRTIWSSDDCGASKAKAHDVRTFGPEVEIYAELTWNSYHVMPDDCVRSASPAPRGSYNVIGRVGTKTGKPVAFTIES